MRSHKLTVRLGPQLQPCGGLTGGGTCPRCRWGRGPKVVQPGLWLKSKCCPPSPNKYPSPNLSAPWAILRVSQGPCAWGTSPHTQAFLSLFWDESCGRQILGLGLEENPGCGSLSRPVPGILPSVLCSPSNPHSPHASLPTFLPPTFWARRMGTIQAAVASLTCVRV